MLQISIATMQYFCRTCLQELPPSTSKQQSKSSRDLQCDEDLVKSLHMTTGIDVNITDGYPKQLCLSCYKKILVFEEFRETALCCAFALHELLLEEDFSENTQNNLQYFCSTCLNQMQTLGNISIQMNDREVQRWIGDCNELKNRTGVDHWPNGICECCREKLDSFLEFQCIVKSSLVQLDNMLYEEQVNKQHEVLTDGQDNDNNTNGKPEESQSSARLEKTSEDMCIKQACDGLIERENSMEGLSEKTAISHNENEETKQITSIIYENAIKKSIKDSAYIVKDIRPEYESLKIPPEIGPTHKEFKKSTSFPTKEKQIILYTIVGETNNEKIAILNQTKSRNNCKPMESVKSTDKSVKSLDISDVGLERKHIKPDEATAPVLKSKTSHPKFHKHLQHRNSETRVRTYSFDRNELTANSSQQINLLVGFPCNNCMKVFKRKAHLNRHRRYSTVCGRI